MNSNKSMSNKSKYTPECLFSNVNQNFIHKYRLMPYTIMQSERPRPYKK